VSARDGRPCPDAAITSIDARQYAVIIIQVKLDHLE
jgi:hypothetical protein